MGTVLELRLPAATPGADALAEAAFAEVAKVEAAASLWRPGTELAAVHARCAAGEAVVLSETLGALVDEALRAAELTGGAFSPAVGALVAAWDLRGEGRTPGSAEKARAAASARPAGVRYERATRTLRLEPGVTLDLDGIAKGFALDRAAAALRARGVDDALLNFGGQLLAIGPPPGQPAREAIVLSPAGPGDPLLSVPLRDASLSTSSNSERVRTVDGKKAGHLLDPRTGDLVPFDGSVSVLAPRGSLADALSTAWAVEGAAGFRRSDPSAPVRRAGSVAFVLPGTEGRCETLADRPFQRLSPPARGVAAAAFAP
jgi:thiamine biosynthesis lipoprotein